MTLEWNSSIRKGAGAQETLKKTGRPHNHKTLKKKTSLEWITEKFSSKKRVKDAREGPSTRKKSDTKKKHSSSTTATSTETETSTLTAGIQPPSGVGDINEWNSFLKAEGIVKGDRPLVRRLDLNDFEYRVFLAHFNSLSSKPLTGVELDSLAGDMIAYDIFEGLEQAKSFCLELDEAALQSGVVLVDNITLLRKDIVVTSAETLAEHERQYKLRQYIRAVNEREVKSLLNNVVSCRNDTMQSDTSESYKATPFFTLANIKRIFRKKRMTIANGGTTKRQRRISMLRDQMLMGINSDFDDDTTQETTVAIDADRSRRNSYIARPKYTPVVYPKHESARRRSSLLTAEQLKVIEMHIDQYLDTRSDDDESDDEQSV